FGGDSGADVADGGAGSVTDSGTDTDTGSSADSGNAALDRALNAAKVALDDKAAALRAGDWTAFGEADERLQRAIEDALAALEN
ncbi:MAG: hypothetical protein VXA46_04490, partial [Aquiluna sp.]